MMSFTILNGNFEYIINPKRHYESNSIDQITQTSSRNIELGFSRKSLASCSSRPLFRSQSTRKFSRVNFSSDPKMNYEDGISVKSTSPTK
jgi:hypothetical protein